jgi:SOS-response transcriptional repressor LexA
MRTEKILSPHYEFEASNTNPTSLGPPKAIQMGEEAVFLSRVCLPTEEANEIQRNQDIEFMSKKDISIEGGLFGVAKQNSHLGVSLDQKYQSSMPYHLEVDNMAPLIPPHADLILKFCTDFASGEICVFRYRGETYCNQIFIEEGRLIAKSVNPKYKPVVLDPEEFHQIAVIDSVHYFLKGRR